MSLNFSVSIYMPMDIILFNFINVMILSAISVDSSALPTWQSEIYFNEGVSVY